MKKRMPKGKVGSYIYLSKPVDKKLKMVCKENKRSISGFIELAIENYLSKYVEFG